MGFTARRLAEAEHARSTMEQFLVERHTGTLSTAGVSVTNKTVDSIAAFDFAVGFAADSVAQLVMRVWRGEDVSRQRVTTTWQARRFRGKPNPDQDWFRFLYIVEASLTARRNAYIFKTKNDAGQVTAMTALHPDQVNVVALGRQTMYFVTFTDPYPKPPNVDGIGVVAVEPSTILHIRGRGGLGQTVVPSPIKQFSTALGLALAKQEHEAALMANGAGYGLVVTFPATMQPDKAKEWQELWNAEHAGPYSRGKTKVTGGGATVQNISMTQAEAEFSKSVGLSLLDVARITNVSAWFLGADDKTSRPVSPEHEMQRWQNTGLNPRLARIESAFNGDPDFGFSPGDYYVAFDAQDVVRGDRRTEDAIDHQRIQDGRILQDEWRLQHGKPPLPGGVGMIPQNTPVGGAPTDTPTMPMPASGTPNE